MFGFPIEYIKYCFEWAKKALIVVTVLFVVFQLFSYFIRSDNNNLPKVDARTQMRKNIASTIDYLEKQSNDGKAMAKAYADSMCFFTGEACKNDASGGVTGLMANSIAWPLSNPPSSGIVVVQNTLQNAGFVPKTYAATEGVGFASLAPFREIWLVFRNLIFMIMVLIVIVIGFMIMFRAKINPQTVITIENALPKIVISMLLVTFSYAIAGFMIDLMYIVMGLIGALFQQIPSTSGIKIEDYIYGKGPTGIFDALNFTSTGEVAQALHNLLPSALKNSLDIIVQFLISIGAFKLSTVVWPQQGKIGLNKGGGINFSNVQLQQLKQIGGAGEAAQQQAGNAQKVGNTGGGLGWISLAAMVLSITLQAATNLIFNSVEVVFFINFMLMLTLLLVWFRLFFMLINTYIQVLLLVLFAPFFMAAEAIPGRSAFSTWLKNMFYHLITYPLFIVIILIGNVITNYTGETNSLILWQPPFLGGLDAHTFAVVVAGVLIFSSPNIIKMIKELTGIKPIAAGQGIGPGTFFGGAAALVSVGTGALAGTRTLMQNMPGVRDKLVGRYDQQKGEFVGGFGGNFVRNRLLSASDQYYLKQLQQDKHEAAEQTTGPSTGQTSPLVDSQGRPLRKGQ